MYNTYLLACNYLPDHRHEWVKGLCLCSMSFLEHVSYVKDMVPIDEQYFLRNEFALHYEENIYKPFLQHGF